MEIDIITIFPEMFPAVLGTSIMKRAQESGRLRVGVHDLRDYTHDKRRTVDDRPYGGGPGMVMKPEPIFEALEAIKGRCALNHGGVQGNPAPTVVQGNPAPTVVQGARQQSGVCQTILMGPQGEVLSAAVAEELAETSHLVIICGHYEGVDERVRKALVDRTISIGDYVVTGGELPALVLIDAVVRFIPGVIGHQQATADDSFATGWLEHPQYTRPPTYKDMAVPDVLRSGDHQRIARWRKLQSVAQTLTSRPDLIKDAQGSRL